MVKERHLGNFPYLAYPPTLRNGFTLPLVLGNDGIYFAFTEDFTKSKFDIKCYLIKRFLYALDA